MVDILLIFHEISPSRSNFWVFDPTVLQFETEVGVDSEEKRVQPSTSGRQPGLAVGVTKDSTLSYPALVPNRWEGFDRGGGMLDSPRRMPHLEWNRDWRGCVHHHRV